jgi:hypothetical protein
VAYDGTWMLDILGPWVARALCDALLPHADYTALIHALFLAACRAKFVADARTALEKRRGSIIYRCKRSLYKTGSSSLLGLFAKVVADEKSPSDACVSTEMKDFSPQTHEARMTQHRMSNI